MFSTLDIQLPLTLATWIQTFENNSVQDYVSNCSSQHQLAGVPELVAWVSWSRRPLVVVQDTGVTTYLPIESIDGCHISAIGGWEEASIHLENSCFCLLHSKMHWMAVVPYHRLSTDCPKPMEKKKAWAHYVSRPINNHGQDLQNLMPICKLHSCHATQIH
jgi:hypothetical protein